MLRLVLERAADDPWDVLQHGYRLRHEVLPVRLCRRQDVHVQVGEVHLSAIYVYVIDAALERNRARLLSQGKAVLQRTVLRGERGRMHQPAKRQRMGLLAVLGVPSAPEIDGHQELKKHGEKR